MFNKQAMFSSKTSEHYTPFELYSELNNEFHFTTDPSTTLDNPLGCEVFFTKETDGLKNWHNWKGNVFINPEYGRNVKYWIQSANNYASVGRGIVVMLLPARSDTKWFHAYVYNKPHVEIRFIKGRIKFRGSKAGAPFPSMIVIFRQRQIKTSLPDSLFPPQPIPQQQSQDLSLQK